MAKEYEYKVNGVQLVSDEQILTAAEILDFARQKGAIPGEPRGYILKGAKQDYRGGDQAVDRLVVHGNDWGKGIEDGSEQIYSFLDVVTIEHLLEIRSLNRTQD